MKIVITGSRTILNQKLLMNRFDISFRNYITRSGTKHVGDNRLTIVHGAAVGVDQAIADAFTSDDGSAVKYNFDGRMFDVTVISYPITKDDWAKYGGRAGHVRNGIMLDTDPDVVFGFWRAGMKSNGTIDCITQAASRGILTLVEVVSEVNSVQLSLT